MTTTSLEICYNNELSIYLEDLLIKPLDSYLLKLQNKLVDEIDNYTCMKLDVCINSKSNLLIELLNTYVKDELKLTSNIVPDILLIIWQYANGQTYKFDIGVWYVLNERNYTSYWYELHSLVEDFKISVNNDKNGIIHFSSPEGCLCRWNTLGKAHGRWYRSKCIPFSQNLIFNYYKNEDKDIFVIHDLYFFDHILLIKGYDDVKIIQKLKKMIKKITTDEKILDYIKFDSTIPSFIIFMRDNSFNSVLIRCTSDIMYKFINKLKDLYQIQKELENIDVLKKLNKPIDNIYTNVIN